MLRRTWCRRLARSNRLIADARQRIEIQKEFISQLEHKKRSTDRALARLRRGGHPGDGAESPLPAQLWRPTVSGPQSTSVPVQQVEGEEHPQLDLPTIQLALSGAPTLRPSGPRAGPWVSTYLIVRLDARCSAVSASYIASSSDGAKPATCRQCPSHPVRLTPQRYPWRSR